MRLPHLILNILIIRIKNWILIHLRQGKLVKHSLLSEVTSIILSVCTILFNLILRLIIDNSFSKCFAEKMLY